MSVRLELDLEIDSKTKKLLGEKPIERATARTVERLLDRVEDATLITQYTQNAKPAKPTGSTYIRTFRMQRSSEKKMKSRRLPAIEGQWEAKTEYASLVIGRANQQAAIHSGRWPALELAINIIDTTVRKIFEEEIGKENV